MPQPDRIDVLGCLEAFLVVAIRERAADLCWEKPEMLLNSLQSKGPS